MPSQSSSVRLAPDEPRPRSEMPCVVGLATRLEERRNMLKPGTYRRRSSRFSPGMRSSCGLGISEIDAGASAAMLAFTVIDCFSGSIFSGSGVEVVWANADTPARQHSSRRPMSVLILERQAVLLGLYFSGIHARDFLEGLDVLEGTVLRPIL